MRLRRRSELALGLPTLPWGPAEENLYPVLDDLLDDWQATAEHAYDGIRVAGTLWSSTSHEVKDYLARSQVPYRWLDIERDSDAAAEVEAPCQEVRRGRAGWHCCAPLHAHHAHHTCTKRAA